MVTANTLPSLNEASERDPYNNNSYGTLVDAPYREVSLPILDVREFFDQDQPEEEEIRSAADLIFNRVDWHWMANGENSLTMGWHPESGFITARWIGYNEAMILYVMGLGAATNPLPAVH